MRHLTTQGIVLSRTNFGEADRIIIFLTNGYGKVRAIAKSVRKGTSKLAGSIEIFSVSEITLVQGKGELRILISARLDRHFGNIVKDIERTNTAYEFMRLLNRATEDAAEPAYFELLKKAFEALDNATINLRLIQVWFAAQLLRLAGHTPNLKTDEQGKKLEAAGSYLFNFDTMNFHKNGVAGNSFIANNIKFLRLVFSGNQPRVLQKVRGVEDLSAAVGPLVNSMLQTHVRTT